MFINTTVNGKYLCNVPRLPIGIIKIVETRNFLRFFFCRYFAFFVIAPEERRLVTWTYADIRGGEGEQRT